MPKNPLGLGQVKLGGAGVVLGGDAIKSSRRFKVNSAYYVILKSRVILL